MTTEQIIQLVVGAGIAVYRDNIRAIINAQCRSFWRARTEDMALLRKRSIGPYGEKDQIPDPLHREELRTLVALCPCVLFAYLIKPFVDSQQFEMKLLSWIVNTVAVAALFRFLIIVCLFVGYRAKLVWEQLSGQAQQLD